MHLKLWSVTACSPLAEYSSRHHVCPPVDHFYSSLFHHMIYMCEFLFKIFLLQISFFGGLVMNEGINWLLKHILQEPRPCGGKPLLSFFFFFFLVSFFVCFLQVSRLYQRPRSSHMDYWMSCIGLLSIWHRLEFVRSLKPLLFPWQQACKLEPAQEPTCSVLDKVTFVHLEPFYSHKITLMYTFTGLFEHM